MIEARSLHRPLEALLSRPQAGRVLSVHRQALNLLLEDGQILSLLHPALGNGPGAALVGGERLPDWQPGDRVQSAAGRLTGPGGAVRWEGATRWAPPPPARPAGPERLALALEQATGLLAAVGSRAGLLPAALSFLEPGGEALLPGRPAGAPLLRGRSTGAPAAVLCEMARQGIARLLAGEWAGGARRLAGLGPGLTPSGDDILCGWVCLLNRAGDPAAGPASAALLALPPSASPPLSRHLLRWAAEWVAGEHHLAWVDSLLAGRRTANG